MGDLLQQAIAVTLAGPQLFCIRQAVAVCRPGRACALIRYPNAHGY
jgi:hypothetical protein